MTAHTPGPWTAEKVATKNGYGVQIHGNRSGASAVVVADMPIAFNSIPPDGHHATWDLQLANARLIAQAPKMVDELNNARAGFAVIMNHADGPVYAAAKENFERLGAILRAVKGE